MSTLFMLGAVSGSGRLRHRIHIIQGDSGCLMCQWWNGPGGALRTADVQLPTLDAVQAFIDQQGWRVQWLPNDIVSLQGPR